MMKRIISIMLAITLYLSAFSFQTFAQGAGNKYTDDEMEFIYLKYMNEERMLEALFNDDKSIGYLRMINDTEENDFFQWSIEKASKIIGEYPDKQDYVEILANLIMMQSGDIAEQVQKQSQYDNLKDGMDYAMDIVNIATDFVGGANLLENIEPIVDAATNGAEVIIDNIELAKYYETSIRDYSQVNLFLKAVAEYAENEELRSAASSLLKANDKLLEKRIEYLTDSTATLVNYGAEFFIENMSFALLKTTDIYESDETVKWYVDCGEKLSDSIESFFAAGKFAFKMTMLAGDIGFGTSDTFNRYQEMKIVSDIARAIVEANSQIIIPKEMNDNSVLADIQTKCDYYKMLITTHARGEYLLYQLLVNDAGLLSQFRVLFDFFKETEKNTDSWYAGQLDCMTEYYGILDRMFELSDVDVPHGLYDAIDVPDNAVEYNGHYYYIYDFVGLAPDDSNTWENALAYCEGVNGYLATITSQEENDFLFSYMKQEGYVNAYFGLSDFMTEGNWTWCNGEQSLYTNWHRNEPDSKNSDEDYAMFYYEYSDGTWSDGEFGDRTSNKGTAFICEWGEYEITFNTDICQYELTEDAISESALPEENLIEELYVLLSTTKFDSNGNVSYSTEYEYDEYGNNIKSINYEPDGSCMGWDDVIYDNKGRVISGIGYDESGNIFSSYNYTYNAEGKADILYFSNVNNYGTEVKHLYDEQQMLIGLEYYNCINDEFDSAVKAEFEYDTLGNRTKQIFYNEDGSLRFWTEYEFDNSGNEILATSYDGKTGYKTWWEEYRYGFIQVKDSHENVAELSESDIADAMYQAGYYTWNWFWDSGRDHVDESDTYLVLGDEGNNIEYKRVTYEGITNVEDVVALTKQYYTEEVARDLILYKQWYEIGNKLYVSEPDGLGGIEADYYEVVINRDSDMQYTLTITEYFQGEKMYEPYDVHYVLVDGYWVFDQSITISDIEKCEICVKSAEKISVTSSIPIEAVEYNGHYYYIYEGQQYMDWNSAQEFCKGKNGYLATITSAEEDEFLYSYIRNSGYDSAMFGLTNQYDSNLWGWVTGEEFIYKNWSAGEPNNQGGNEHYGMYYKKNTDGSWNDGSGLGGSFICEWGEY